MSVEKCLPCSSLFDACKAYNEKRSGTIIKEGDKYVLDPLRHLESNKTTLLFTHFKEDLMATPPEKLNIEHLNEVEKTIGSIHDQFVYKLYRKKESCLGRIELSLAALFSWLFPCCKKSVHQSLYETVALQNLLSDYRLSIPEIQKSPTSHQTASKDPLLGLPTTPLESIKTPLPVATLSVIVKKKGDNYRVCDDPKTIREKLETTQTEAYKYAKDKALPNTQFNTKVDSNNPPKPERHIVDLDHLRIVTSSINKKPKKREDADFNEPIQLSLFGEEKIIYLAGICDGHIGPTAALYVKKNVAKVLHEKIAMQEARVEKFLPHLSARDKELVVFWNALKLTPVQLSEDYIKSVKGSKTMDGTTLAMVLVEGNNVWMANTGDSGALMVKNQTFIKLSEEAKKDFTNPRMVQPILDRDGIVEEEKLIWHLGTMRSLGNEELPGNNPRPKITLNPLDKGLIIIGSDGLWDVCTPAEILTYIENKSLLEIANQVATQARLVGSHDDITVMVISQI